MENLNIVAIFVTGLTAGGLSCLALQGGLLAGVIANQKEKSQTPLWMPVGMFLVAKLIVHTLFGLLLGLAGSVIRVGIGVRLVFQIFTAVFMFATAMNLLDVHPLFRFVVFQPPKILQRLVRRSAKSEALFAPALLGVMTIFVPCGVTQAMEVLAINSANPWIGGTILFAFVLGTLPLFAVVGLATAKLSERWNRVFSSVAAVVLIGMAVYALHATWSVLRTTTVISNLSNTFFQKNAKPMMTPARTDEAQKIVIEVLGSGYRPNRIQVRRDVPVELTLRSNNTYSCALAFIFPSFGIQTTLKSNDTQTFTFIPTKSGRYPFSCSMGMYTGEMEVL